MAKKPPELKSRRLGTKRFGPSTKEDLPGSEKARIDPKNVRLEQTKIRRKVEQASRTIPDSSKRRGGADASMEAKREALVIRQEKAKAAFKAETKAGKARAALSVKKPVKTKADKARAALSVKRAQK